MKKLLALPVAILCAATTIGFIIYVYTQFVAAFPTSTTSPTTNEIAANGLQSLLNLHWGAELAEFVEENVGLVVLFISLAAAICSVFIYIWKEAYGLGGQQ